MKIEAETEKNIIEALRIVNNSESYSWIEYKERCEPHRMIS